MTRGGLRPRTGIIGVSARAALTLLVAGALWATPARAQNEWTSSRPDGDAPIGVMAERAHERGGYMLSYRFMRERLTDNRAGTATLRTIEVLSDFFAAPLRMTTTTHMADLTYAPSDAVTLVGMVSWMDKSMDHVTRTNANFAAESSGLGDIGIAALFEFERRGSTRMHLNAGISIPIGSIEEIGANPMSVGNEVQLPYPMQLGSGTWDLTPGLTVLGMSEGFSWGFQAKGTFRLGENDRGWTSGDVLEGTGWYAYRAMDRLSVSARVLAKRWGDYAGHDDAFTNPMAAPTIREELRGGTRVDVPLGLNYLFPDGALSGHRLAVEWHLPVFQDLHGPQLGADWVLTVGWRKSFTPPGVD